MTKSPTFTIRWLETIKAEKRADFHDPKTPGLQIRVTPSNIKTWAYVYWSKSLKKARRVTIGKFPAIGYADARIAALALLSKVENGEDPAGDKQELKQAATWIELATDWLEFYAKTNLRKTTWQEYWRMLELDVFPELGAMKADEVSKIHFARIHGRISKRGKVTANRTITLIKSIESWAVSSGRLNYNRLA